MDNLYDEMLKNRTQIVLEKLYAELKDIGFSVNVRSISLVKVTKYYSPLRNQTQCFDIFLPEINKVLKKYLYAPRINVRNIRFAHYSGINRLCGVTFKSDIFTYHVHTHLLGPIDTTSSSSSSSSEDISSSSSSDSESCSSPVVVASAADTDPAPVAPVAVAAPQAPADDKSHPTCSVKRSLVGGSSYEPTPAKMSKYN